MVENLMAITNTEGAGAPGQPERPARTAQEQLNLSGLPVVEAGAAAELSIDEAVAPAADGRRMFVPSNRECIMQQLGALILSPDFPPRAGTPADAARGPLLVHDGLRSLEVDILADGRPQRFPVLAEIRSEAGGHGASAFGILDVVALHFRNEDEASDFRFRPVDELDTQHLPCIANRSLFALDGAARFDGLEHDVSSGSGRRAALADRIAGGISCLLELASVDPACCQTVADLLSRQGSVPWLECLCGASMMETGIGSSGAHATIVRAFIEHAGTASGGLVDTIGRYLGELSDPDVARALPAWMAMADAVLSNRMVLDGKVLSDDGTIALRAAILAVVVDDVRDLVAFLYAQRPAGRQVVVAAAFLIGLRNGVSNLSWHRKLPYLDLLSPLLVALHDPEQATRDDALRAFQEEPDETVVPFELVLYWRDHSLIRWAPQGSDSATTLELATSAVTDGEEPSHQEQADLIKQSDHGSLIEGPDGRMIEVTIAASSNQMSSLRLVLGKEDKLRKPKEILEASCTPGICWRAGITVEGVHALHADIQGRPPEEVLQATILKLPEALSLYLVPMKPKRRAGTARSRTARKKTV
jgi:hypothetical protein